MRTKNKNSDLAFAHNLDRHTIAGRETTAGERTSAANLTRNGNSQKDLKEELQSN